MERLSDADAWAILNCMGDGVYVTDVERHILFWNKAAEQITGWKAEDLLGQSCFNSILSHIDKDGRRLCGRDHCPLHRSIVTGESSECPLMFAKKSDGARIPLQTTVAPLRDGNGVIIGGVEVFRDLSPTFGDLQKAKAIQSISLRHDLPPDGRVGFETLYIPHDVVGGDYYGVRRLNSDQYGFFLADAMGHGLAAALYTMYLSALWDRYFPLLKIPSAFAAKMNSELSRIAGQGEAFAAGVCGMLDLSRQELLFAGAGNPPAIRIHADGGFELLDCSGVPFGVMADAPYHDVRVAVHPGDRLLFFSDGATEICRADGKQLGIEGLIGILKRHGYPESSIQAAPIAEELLTYSNAIRLEDDVTFMEIRLARDLVPCQP